MKSRPRRILKGRPAPPDVAADVGKMRKVRDKIDPGRSYRLEMPDGSVVEYTGAELIRSADDMVAMFDAIESGDDKEFIRIFESI